MCTYLHVVRLCCQLKRCEDLAQGRVELHYAVVELGQPPEVAFESLQRLRELNQRRLEIRRRRVDLHVVCELGNCHYCILRLIEEPQHALQHL